MNGARLTQVATGLDLQRIDGRVPRAEDGTEAAQHGSVRLQIFPNEPVIDDDPNFDYTRWYEVVWNMALSKSEKEFEIKRRILGTTGVVRLLTFSWTQEGHVVDIEGIVLTEWGEVDISQTVTPL
jgi:hypothetical protein